MTFPLEILPDEVILNAIEDGVAEVAARVGAGTLDALLDVRFASLTATRRAALKRWLSTNAPTVIAEYPADTQSLPCFAVTLSPEQDQEYVGAQGVLYQHPDDPVAGAGEEQIMRSTEAVQWTSTIGILVYAENGDLCRWLYHLARGFLSDRRRALTRRPSPGILAGPFKEMHLSGQALGFEPRFLQSGRLVYTRALQATCVFDNHIGSTLALQEIESVDARSLFSAATIAEDFTAPA